MVFHWNFNPFTPCASHNTDLPSKNSISKTVKVNIAFKRKCFEEYSINFLMISRLIDFALVVLQLFMFKMCGIIGISKIVFFSFSGIERVKQTQKKLKTAQKNRTAGHRKHSLWPAVRVKIPTYLQTEISQKQWV